MVTTHPPVIVDNTQTPPTPTRDNDEVVIVANETNKTQINESSSTTTDDECCPSLDSLEYPPPTEFRDKPTHALPNAPPNATKLDESEVLIVDSSYVIDDSGLDVSEDLRNSRLLDTSHVSVVTVGDESVRVKDSASFLFDDGSNINNNKGGDGNHLLGGSTSDLSHSSSGKCGSSKSESGDDLRGTSIILEAANNRTSGGLMDDGRSGKMNGGIAGSTGREELYKKNNLNGKIYPDSCESVVSVSDSR